jgi:hypothetical protein
MKEVPDIASRRDKRMSEAINSITVHLSDSNSVESSILWHV